MFLHMCVCVYISFRIPVHFLSSVKSGLILDLIKFQETFFFPFFHFLPLSVVVTIYFLNKIKYQGLFAL